MTDGLIDWSQFKGEDHYFIGNHRAIVEDNDDPQKAGRVRVRIYGLHSPFGTETPTGDLPWAQPCLSIGWSGGHNIYNVDKVSTTGRYSPGGQIETDIVPAKNVQVLSPQSGSSISSFVDVLPPFDSGVIWSLVPVPRVSLHPQ